MTLRVGILGCGYISQARHLPMIREVDGIELEALCDLSPGTLELVAEYHDVKKRYLSYEEMLADDAIDAVGVLSYDHAPDILAALRAGKHVLTEKPLAFTIAEAEEILEALRANPRLVLSVGYQKLHDPAVMWLADRVAERPVPRIVEIHDYAAKLARVRGDFGPVFRVEDLPSTPDLAARSFIGAAGGEVVHHGVWERICQNLLPTHGHFVRTYLQGLMLGCHDLGVLSYCFGAPQKVLYAHSTGADRLHALVELKTGAPCSIDLQLGTNYGWWDERFSVYDDDEQVDLSFGNPFLAFDGTEIRTRSTRGENVRTAATAFHGYEDGFKNEWKYFRDCVAGLSEVRATAELATSDIVTVTAIVNQLDPSIRFDGD